ncbi:hypothetical protein ABEB36_000212 [Hypothenemus hampei]|uniref:Uncharacterized protein n=1 Tax=Hypothenemus hampei TaxID=57062 RepID=A0ABD1F6N0_HYPHA
MANANSANGAYHHIINSSRPKKSTQEYQGIGTEKKSLLICAEVSAPVNSPYRPEILRRSISKDPTTWKRSQQSLILLVSLMPGMSEISLERECESHSAKSY